MPVPTPRNLSVIPDSPKEPSRADALQPYGCIAAAGARPGACRSGGPSAGVELVEEAASTTVWHVVAARNQVRLRAGDGALHAR